MSHRPSPVGTDIPSMKKQSQHLPFPSLSPKPLHSNLFFYLPPFVLSLVAPLPHSNSNFHHFGGFCEFFLFTSQITLHSSVTLGLKVLLLLLPDWETEIGKEDSFIQVQAWGKAVRASE